MRPLALRRRRCPCIGQLFCRRRRSVADCLSRAEEAAPLCSRAVRAVHARHGHVAHRASTVVAKVLYRQDSSWWSIVWIERECTVCLCSWMSVPPSSISAFGLVSALVFVFAFAVVAVVLMSSCASAPNPLCVCVCAHVRIRANVAQDGRVIWSSYRIRLAKTITSQQFEAARFVRPGGRPS